MEIDKTATLNYFECEDGELIVLQVLSGDRVVNEMILTRQVAIDLAFYWIQSLEPYALIEE